MFLRTSNYNSIHAFIMFRKLKYNIPWQNILLFSSLFFRKNAVYAWVGGLFKYTVIPYIKYFKLLSKSSKSFLLMFVLCIFMYAFFFYWWITKCILNSNMKNGKGFLLKYSICSNKISCETDIAFLCNVCIFGCCFFQIVDFLKWSIMDDFIFYS